MPKVSLVIIMLLQAVTSFAQNYFVFIGSDNRQPFYIRVDSEFHSSSAEGHVILSRLKDGNYNITLGFPGQTQPEQHYSFSIGGKDQAFELRSQDAGSSDLRLYDLQNNHWLSPQGGGGGIASGEARSTGVKKDDAFSRMMAGVVHDTAVLYNSYAMERALSDSPANATVQSAPVQTLTTAQSLTTTQSPTTTQSGPPDTASATAAITTPPTTHPSSDSTANKPADTTIAATSNSATSPYGATPPATSSASATPLPAARIITMAHQPAARFNDSSATSPLYRSIPKDSAATAAHITKLSERHTTKNVRLVYADRSGTKKADTIDVVIPIDSPATAKTAGHQPHAADSNHVSAARTHDPNADTPAVSSSTAYRPTDPPTPSAATRPHPADSSHKPGKTIVFVNSDCHDFATDFDVDKLRIKMLQSNGEERIALARKAFKVKCFYTRQIRALSDVFTSDAARFRFFETAWPFAADEHFHELSDLLTDPVYTARFKTMTHQQ